MTDKTLLGRLVNEQVDTSTREGFEAYVISQLENILAAYRKYNPNGEWLNMSIMIDKEEGFSYFQCANEYFDDDKETPVKVTKTIEGIL